MRKRLWKAACAAVLSLAVIALPAHAEQAETFPEFDVHYIVVNTHFLSPDVAERYGIVRGDNRAMINLSVLDKEGEPQTADVSVAYTNLLGQRVPLVLREVREQGAVYYIGQFKYTDQDILTFEVTVDTGDGPERTFEFRQQMFEEPSR